MKKKCIEYHRDGSVHGRMMRSGYFKNGEQTGTWTTYAKNGRLVKVTEFK